LQIEHISVLDLWQTQIFHIYFQILGMHPQAGLKHYLIHPLNVIVEKEKYL
jgi:hypothetical protein